MSQNKILIPTILMCKCLHKNRTNEVLSWTTTSYQAYMFGNVWKDLWRCNVYANLSMTAEGRVTHRHYRRTPISAGNTFQDLPRLRETTDNTERYIYSDIHVTNINRVKFN